MSPPRPLQNAALAAALVATVPYLVLKLMWLSGSTVGMSGGMHIDEMNSTRFQVGNTVTVVLMLVAAGLVVVLTRSWAERVPARLVFVLGAGATGLLAPILLGLPLGLVAQVLAKGDVRPAEDAGLEPWVFGVVYSGFALLASAMGVLLLGYVARRWGRLIADPPERPSWPATLAGALGLLPFSVAMIFWGSLGPGGSGPQGMDQPAQRTVLLVTGLLSGAAFVLPYSSRSACRWPRVTWLTAWTGCCVAALQGPAQLLLAQGGKAEPAVAAIALLSTPGACLYGMALLRRQIMRVGAAPRRSASLSAHAAVATGGGGSPSTSRDPRFCDYEPSPFLELKETDS
jgi:hypothetical protein